ncbi:MAG: hypothetical protein ACEQR8_08120 [Cypionkella sp.]
MHRSKRGLLLAVAVAMASWSAAGPAESPIGSRTPAAIAAMDLPALVAAIEANRAAVTHYLAELHRRHPEEVEAPDMTGIPPLDPASALALRRADDDRLVRSMERVAAELDALVERGKALASAESAGPAAAPISPKPQATSDPDEAPYCKKMYARAYSLCGFDDRGCKMIAANDWGICQKTGRWP